jgi:hypothetical protein
MAALEVQLCLESCSECFVGILSVSILAMADTCAGTSSRGRGCWGGFFRNFNDISLY